MENQKNRKTYSFSNGGKIDGLKNKKQLKLRIMKLTNNYFKPQCDHYINNIRSFNLKIMEFSGGKKSIEKQIKESQNFRFGKKKDYFIHLTDLSPYKMKVGPFLKNFKKTFTKDEIEIIKKDKEYYLSNDLLKENITMFNIPPLYQIINKEEEDEKKAAKVFHNLNYFNQKRRNSLLFMNNLIKKKSMRGGVSFIKEILEPKPKKVYKYENSPSDVMNEKINYNNLIEKEIRQGVNKLNDNEFKKIARTKNLILDLERESKEEIEKFIKDKDEYDLINKMNIFMNTNKYKNEKKFPLIKNNTFTKENKSISGIKSNKIKKKINLKMKKPVLTKKIIDYEQKIIRDVNKRIKTNYENIYKQNKNIE